MTRRATPADPHALDTFLEGIRLGLPDKDAAARAGWNRTTIYAWRVEAEAATARGDKLTKREIGLTDFADAWEKAVAEFKTGHLACITRAASTGQWQAAAWILERRLPTEFGRRLLEVTGADGGPIQVEERLAGVMDLAEKVRADLLRNQRRNGAPDLAPSPNGH